MASSQQTSRNFLICASPLQYTLLKDVCMCIYFTCGNMFSIKLNSVESVAPEGGKLFFMGFWFIFQDKVISIRNAAKRYTYQYQQCLKRSWLVQQFSMYAYSNGPLFFLPVLIHIQNHSPQPNNTSRLATLIY